MQSPALRTSLDKVFMSVVVNGSPAEFQRFALDETKTGGKIISDSGIRSE